MSTTRSLDRERPTPTVHSRKSLARSRPFHTFVALAILALGSSCSGPQKQELSQAEKARIVEEAISFLSDYGAALESGDQDKVRDLFVPDARFSWNTDGRKVYANPDQLLQSLGKLSSSGTVFRTEYSDVEAIALTGGLAFVSAGFQTKATIEGGGGFAFGGIVTMLIERFEDRWRVVKGHTSTPGGPPGN